MAKIINQPFFRLYPGSFRFFIFIGKLTGMAIIVFILGYNMLWIQSLRQLKTESLATRILWEDQMVLNREVAADYISLNAAILKLQQQVGAIRRSGYQSLAAELPADTPEYFVVLSDTIYFNYSPECEAYGQAE